MAALNEIPRAKKMSKVVNKCLSIVIKKGVIDECNKKEALN